MKETAIRTIADFMTKIEPVYGQDDCSFIRRAAEIAEKLHEGQSRASGEPYLIHPLQVAEILVDLSMDAVCIAAALLHDTLEDTILSREQLRNDFGADVEALVFGVTKIEIVNEKRKSSAEAETIRKMLFAMVKDVRVILIKLADKLHNMRTLQFKSPDRQKVIAQDTLDIFAPLAARLGMSWMKDELEDLSLKFLQPEVYQDIKSFVSQKKAERSDYLLRVRQAILDAAVFENLQIDVQSRAKHFWSIYEKMKSRNKKLEEIYDLLGIRILCQHVYECYVILGLVHRLWMPIEGRFKDYIAMPKSNKYQSLHTTVMCYGGKLLEIQIRTFHMDETAHYGVAAHWVYKQKGGQDKPDLAEIELISRLKDMNTSGLASTDFLEDIKRELLKDSIYVFTPKGDVIQLPAGSTAIDFAYHIHTEVGNHAVGAKADGAIIPLRTALKNTQVIEIITSPHGRPHIDWLRTVRTSKTKHKIRSWLNHHDSSIIVDRNIVARKPAENPPATSATPKNAALSKETGMALPISGKESQAGIRVDGESNMMIRFATCCQPKTGDDIIGYVSRGRGIIVHRRDCRNFMAIPGLEERMIEVEWESVSPHIQVQLYIRFRRDINVFSELERDLRKHMGHLVEGKTENDHTGAIEGRFTVDLKRKADYKKFIKDLRDLDGILELRELGRSD